MSRWILVLLVVLAAGWVGGCRRQQDSPPQFNHGMTGGSLMPIRVPDSHRDKSILKAAANTGEPLPKDESESDEADAITIDDSTAEAVAKAYADIISSGRIGDLVDIIDPEQKDVAVNFVDVMEPLLEIAKELGLLLDEKFPGHAIQLNLPGTSQAGQLTVVSVEVDSGDEERAKAVVQNEKGGPPIPLQLRSVDGSWRVHDPRIEAFTANAGWEDKFDSIKEALEDILAKVKNDEFTNENEVKVALFKVVASQLAPSDVGDDSLGESPPKRKATPPPQRSKSMEETMMDTTPGGGVLNRGRR